MTLAEIKQDLKDRLEGIEKSVAWISDEDFEHSEYYAYSNCLELLEGLEATNPTKAYLLVGINSCDSSYLDFNGVYESEYEARKHSIGYDVIEFELNKEDNGVIL